MAEFLKEPVLRALGQAGRPLKSKDLARSLGIQTSEYREFRRFLHELLDRGDLYRVKGGRYALPDRLHLVVGHLTVVRSGAAFLIPEKSGEDVYVAAEARGNAFHGDKVQVRVEHRGKGRPEGRVVRVLERARTEFVGTLRRAGPLATLSVDDPKFRRDIFLPLQETQEAQSGEKVLVAVTDWGSATASPVGRVTERLGMPGTPGLDVLIIVKHNGLPTTFPDDVERAAAAIPDPIPESEIARRVDLRREPVVTIDPITAKDFDDALSLSLRPDGNLDLGVHIADVSYYVRMDDVLDKEAWKRGTSVYLVDRVIPMLPEKLSNHLCSLNPNVDRLAFSVLAVMTPQGRVVSTRIVDTVIRSARRLSYEEAQGHFDGTPALREALAPVSGVLDRLQAMARVLHEKRVKRGALDFDLPESRVVLDEQGMPIDIKKLTRLESHRLVEEFMLLANEIVARELRQRKYPTLFRAHEDPPERKLERLQGILGRFGYALNPDANGRISPKELQRVLETVDGKPEEMIVNTMVLRSLALARYDPHPLGHYGLALKDYTHFTSPIRRYPDLLVHRTLRVLAGTQPHPMKDPARYREWINDTAIQSSETERRAEGAERDSVELKKIEFMERHVGSEFRGVVTSVEVFGFFVELEDYHVSGLVHVNALEDDYYEYWEEDFALVGSNTGRRFTLGDRIQVQVLSVSKELRQIDFILASASEEEALSPAQRVRRAQAATAGKGRGQRGPSRREAFESRRKQKPRPGGGPARGSEGRGTRGDARGGRSESRGGSPPARPESRGGRPAPRGEATPGRGASRGGPSGRSRAARKTATGRGRPRSGR